MAEAARQYEILEHRLEGIHAAAEFFDRELIEAEAQELIESRHRLPAPEVRHQERQDNARTALMEALTAAGHLSTVEIEGKPAEINAQVLSRLLNGWDENLPRHELRRRFAEICNELVIQKVFKAIIGGMLPADTEITEISDYPEALRGTKLGYRDKNKKGMVRTTSFHGIGDGCYRRTIEQISRSNGTWQSTFGFLAACNIGTQQESPDLAALEAPIVHSRKDYANGAIDIMCNLDRYAGAGVRYGDSGEQAARHPAYERLREESQRREEDILCFVDDLAKLEAQLDGWREEGKMSFAERNQTLGEEIMRILNAICTLDPGYAEDTFGSRSASVFHEAALLSAQGRHQEAAILLEENEYLKETVTFCGMALSVDKAKEMGLEVNSFGQLVEKGKESWKWKQGVCQVKACPSPKPTEVGPCSVCRHCQREFDEGRDPTKGILARTARSVGSLAMKLFSRKPKYTPKNIENGTKQKLLLTSER